ncbi:MAG: hypothetical protein A3B68_05935 [Candidatus Melainabacteria bacterium RIFCSPHIGHO2_02_FULL_34_12]|nr:MAG: hypothetical protein A3B68_05935 [Candidatus Melainabacteria bacterium RIFCSPHIGHO2_02_FULL_34_12]
MQKNYGVKILSFSGSLPSKVVKNKDLEKLFETSDEWIFTRTGISERRIISGNESSLTLSYDAALKALANAELSPEQIDLIIVATATPDMLYPSTACLLQGKLGAKNAVSFDISAACSGFIYGMVTAAQFIYSGMYKNILLVGVDVHSRFIDWSERSVAVLFGDGAGATVLSRCLPQDDELCGYLINSDSDINLDLNLGNKNVSFDKFKEETSPDFVRMNGRAIYQFALRVVPDVVNKLMDKLNMTTKDIDYFVPHQANQRIIDAVAQRIGFSPDKVISNIKYVGNTSAASIPLAIVDAIDKGQITVPSKLLLVGFGAGLTWGAIVIKLNVNGKGENV